ncbi:hypothetical protein CXF80_05805 [Shewanella sp. Actino-trap-3]|uniref:hypothetical protein n=1 Tax=Shewanella sp. Actino-trap-3 TaxID=2058331 RepID=UPI000C33D473|nr:hypothetical protein [Shewanella sp. Actino-trap-3]PKG77867.1 hypothetical protein CXF80_05805 [Shewanella sp. Actino-trap-3]
MIDAVCTYGDERHTFSILKFQALPEIEIEQFRQFLECPECKGKAYYRKRSSDGKAACFGSRYHIVGCDEGSPSTQREREVSHSLEVNQIIAGADVISIDFLLSKAIKKSKDKLSTYKKSTAEQTTASVLNPKVNPKPDISSRIDAEEKPKSNIKRLGLEKILNSLMRGSDLAQSSTLIELDAGYTFKAKNLFVNFADAEPSDSVKQAKPKMYWGTISHLDKDLDWLNPSDCNDVGIPLSKYKSTILSHFNISEPRQLEGAGIIVFGKCFWNAKKTRKIIELWNAERIFISVLEE